ncbi:BnaCnng59980D [Brassica napus]|uniref:BnaCnng59980D protein n=1 Tax=Brassica napus TaxID=3708 RepID=A0A078JTA7_BRANA|nr:BnaCnng59980D [Brassica napus]
MARHLEEVMGMATTTQFHVSYLVHVVFLALLGCCVLSAVLLSCADGASDDRATSGNTPAAGGCGGAGCGGGCGG